MDCNDKTFETINSNEVSYGVAHPLLDITETDCLKTAVYKIASKLEYLIENMCTGISEKNAIITQKEIQSDIVVDYSISPILTAKKGTINNSIQIDWSGIELNNNDTLVQKSIEFYNEAGVLIASTSKTSQVIEFKPKDYPLSVGISALVTTSEGTVKTSSNMVISADIETSYSPILEIKKGTEIQDPNLLILNGEINKIKVQINEINSKLQ